MPAAMEHEKGELGVEEALEEDSAPLMPEVPGQECSTLKAVTIEISEKPVINSLDPEQTPEPVDTVPTPNQNAYPSVEELVAKARAPVKHEYLRQAGPRILANSVVVAEKVVGSISVEKGGEPGGGSTTVSLEKKSKRQLRKERKQARSSGSAENVCGAVARTGDVKSCRYGTSCRFNHDLAAFLAQKPPDIPGKCPFVGLEIACPYGYACRFAGTHTQTQKPEGEEILIDKKNQKSGVQELNNLNKDFQKLLWKNAVTFPRADAELGALGLLGKAKRTNVKQVSMDSKEENGPDISQDPSLTTVHFEDKVMEIDDPSKRVQGDGAQSTQAGDLEKEEPVAFDGSYGEVGTEKPNANTVLNGIEEEAPPQKRVRTTVDSETTEFATIARNISSDKATTITSALPTSSVVVPNRMDPSSPHKIEVATSHVNGSSESCGTPVNGHMGKSDTIGLADESAQNLDKEVRLSRREKKLIDFRGKLYLAPLTTVGNLPFRRVCKHLGADITCGEMAMCTSLLQGQASEWALLRRHAGEDVFGVQICGSYADTVARAAELIERECEVDFIDLNLGCPIDLVVNKGAGSCLLTKPARLEQIVRATAAAIDNPLTLKLRMGYFEGRNCAHTLLPQMHKWGAAAVTIHGRTRQQRYSKVADWNYIQQCTSQAPEEVQLIGNGDVFSYTEFNDRLQSGGSKLATCMIARGALIKPWIFTEIKEQRHWDITAEERLSILRDYVSFGLEHWGSDSKGVETTRHFLLEWLSYAHRYIPVGVLEVVPQRLNWRPPNYFGRNDLETMMASDSAADWVRITELLLGPPPPGFLFSPKHKSNAYDKVENG